MDAGTLIRAIEAAGYDAQDYSGRGMYGKRCVSLSTEDGLFSVGAAVVMAMVDEGENPRELADLSVSQDSMGRGMVVYFPGVAWPGDGQ